MNWQVIRADIHRPWSTVHMNAGIDSRNAAFISLIVSRYFLLSEELMTPFQKMTNRYNNGDKIRSDVTNDIINLSIYMGTYSNR